MNTEIIEKVVSKWQQTVIVDLDGTLALIEHRRHLVSNGRHDWDEFYKRCVDDEPNWPVIVTIRSLYQNALGVLILSGRSEVVRKETEDWLLKYDVPYDGLVMRPVKDYTPDDELKKSWLDQIGVEKVYCVFDDRQKVVDMWRQQGLTVFQVAKGNF